MTSKAPTRASTSRKRAEPRYSASSPIPRPRSRTAVKVLEEKLVKRKIALKALSHGKIEQAAGGTSRQALTLNQGIATEKAKEIVKVVKEMKVKAQGSVQGDQVRVSSKSRDTLQDIMAALKERDFGIPLQFTNYR